MNKAKSCLEAKVIAKNVANATLLEILPKVIEALKPFEGKKVFNQGNTLSQKTRAALPELPNTHEVQGWYRTSDYSLYVYIKVSCLYPNRSGEYHTCTYQEASAFVGEIDKFDLKSVYAGPWTLRTDYTAAAIQAARERVKVADKELREAQSALESFGEHDNF